MLKAPNNFELDQNASIHRREIRRIVFQAANVLIDIATCLIAFSLVVSFYYSNFLIEFFLGHVSIFIPIFIVFAIYSGAYSTRALTALGYAIRCVGLAAASAVTLLIFITFYTKASADISRVLLTAGTFVSLVLLIGVRVLLHQYIIPRLLPGIDGIVVILDGGPDIKVDKASCMVIDGEALGVSVDDPESLNHFGHSVHGADRVIVSCPMEKRPAWAAILRAAGTHGEIVSGSLADLRPIGLNHVGELVSLVVSSQPLGLRARFAKRVMDVLFAGVALILLTPVFLLIAVAIKLDDPGPVFFRQKRMGRTNRFFEVLKFRSMTARKLDFDGIRSASKNDDRITRVGGFLRRTSLDELPQLINVLRGDMSLVGPRPHALGSTAGEKLFWEIEAEYWQRHSLRPGLTGLAQVRGLRGATDEEHQLSSRLRSDLEYIANWSIWTDLLIMLKTLKVLVHDRAF